MSDDISSQHLCAVKICHHITALLDVTFLLVCDHVCGIYSIFGADAVQQAELMQFYHLCCVVCFWVNER